MDDLGSDGQLRRYELTHRHQLQQPDGELELGRVSSQRAGDVTGPVRDEDRHDGPHYN